MENEIKLASGAMVALGVATAALVVMPYLEVRDVKPPPQLKAYTSAQLRGREVYIANGCVYCHSQQVRDPTFTNDVDRGWGARATVPADYVYDRPHLLGTMRTGPDLINVGQRLPDEDWHLIHLYDPRSLVAWSIMPAYPYLFERKTPGEVQPGDRVVRIPGPRAPQGVTIVAKPEAIALADYLISLKRQYPVPAPSPAHASGGAGGAH